MTMAEVAEVVERVHQECSNLLIAGQAEYAHDYDDGLRNFNDLARKCGIPREAVLLIFLTKHIDGIAAYAKGHRSQRESIKGRINDAIVYLSLLRAMVEEDEGKPNQEKSMNKIPTVFVRDPDDMGRVTSDVTPGCEWVFAGQGVATRKFDGTNIRVTTVGGKPRQVEKRRNPTKEAKAAGVEPGYVEAARGDPQNRHIWAAVELTDFSSWPDGAWSCEAVGPKIQGGAEDLPPSLIPFSLPLFVVEEKIGDAPRDYDGLSEFLREMGWEGIVWHHPDGRMAKIKGRDFGIHRGAIK